MKKQTDRQTEYSKKEQAVQLLSYIFDEVLPGHGMTKRKNQKELSLIMLHALFEDKLALCEAEVGTGKTHAYLLAVTVYSLFSKHKPLAVISTSTIALQEAITKEYIPQISHILMEQNIIDRPLSFTVRKGKAHYVCDLRLRTYESSIRSLCRPEDSLLLRQLEQLWQAQDSRLDLDWQPFTPYVKERINVSQCSERCPHVSYCRYAGLSRRWLTGSYDFQIANHHYILADILNRKQGKKQIFPYYNIVVFDEAHKLIDAARQIYCVRLAETDIPKLVRLIRPETFLERQTRQYIIGLCEKLSKINTELFRSVGGDMIEVHSCEDTMRPVYVDRHTTLCFMDLLTCLDRLEQFLGKPLSNVCSHLRSIHQTERAISEKLKMLLQVEKTICWVEKTEGGILQLCAVPKELEQILYRDLWNTGLHSIVTSGTISVGGDFSHFKRLVGIDQLWPQSRKVIETVKPSPFNYRSHALLYIPERMPFPDIREERYIEAVSGEIRQLVQATHGHTLILFTSYWLMDRIFYELERPLSQFPLFMMKRGRVNTLEEFKKSGNGVLFASDSGGEGIDLPGDILSSVIVVKLPFPVPDPVMEYERSLYGDFEQYKREVVIPGMLIKLRQWIGRGIRKESDTAVFSILDSRARLRGAYRRDILTALPDMPVTDRIADVRRFIIEKKTEGYFHD